MPDKINIVSSTSNMQEFWKNIKNIVSQYAEMLRQPAQKEETLLFENIPAIQITEPKSIIREDVEKEENTRNRKKAIPVLSNPAYKKEPKIVEDGGRIK